MNTLSLNGMNNKTRAEDLPKATQAYPWDKARNAVNCQFTDNGEILLPRVGKSLEYAGNVSSLFIGKAITLFSEGSSLKKLNADNTATVLKTGIGTSKVFYTEVGEVVFWANETKTGRIINGINTEWGCPRPDRQPDCSAVANGGLYAGDYRVAITWLSGEQESGTGNSVRVTVPENGGIHLTNFQTPPTSVDGLAIYMSSVNGEELYLYAEYSWSLSDVTLTKRVLSVPLATQFMLKPFPSKTVCSHNGRIYYADKQQVYFTEPHNYGLQQANNYLSFDSDVKVIISTPPALYVGTEKQLYKITGFDLPEDQAPQLEVLQSCSSVAGSECYDPNGNDGYCLTSRGFMKFSPDGVTELSYADCAIPLFTDGTMQVTEHDGLKYLTFVGTNGTQNPLANSDYNQAELLRGSL